MKQPTLSVIIVNWNVCDLLRDCLRSVLWGRESEVRSQEANRSALIPALELRAPEVLVVDNASIDGSAEMVAREFPTVRLIRNAENLGYARANNLGIAASTGRYVLLLNSDTVVPPAALAELVAFMDAHPEAGACSPQLLGADGRPQPYAFGCDPMPDYLMRRGLYRLLLRRPLHDWGAAEVQAVDWVSGACLLTRRAVIDQVGALDEQFFMYFEDNDWCLRMRAAGWKVYYNPNVCITHIGGQGLIQNPAARRAYYRSLEYFYAKHYGPLARGLLKLFLPVYWFFFSPNRRQPEPTR
ncbi:MAG: glycosyltransferase family 2 protein [Chloroflexi bacterium HGW-Chloroflexi-1]|nr:MAG: glycosyltransferase family 2 protein [Chloroflexi bacterium HGW-Chloroflexi-1]